ncbi:uncharacterized protein LOC109810149 [Cajanus cajan]|uniref:uncharacterized protein LOC109810149 n=1 Tax=Cajanus cajan TaxID=3821 RepID=UPI0010FBA958|nr:uncharacterized protein LOC109810149 [Cajanus cajan]
MGGCVSGPKDVALNEGEEAPIETPVTPPNVEEKVDVAQENNQEEAEKNEEPLVDVSDSKEEKVEAKVEEAEVVAVVETKEPEKEEVKVEAVVETKEPEKEEVEAEQPKAEEKTEATLVTV